MAAGLEADSAADAEPTAGQPVAPAATRVGAFAWDWPSFARCAKAFCLATLAVFVLGVGLGAYLPALPGRVLGLLEAINLWPTAYLTHLVPIFLFILLANLKSAFIAALLGPASVWVNARLNARSGRPSGPRPWAFRLVEGGTYLLAALVIRAGRLVFAGIGDERREFAARTSAGLGALVPSMALGVNALALGLWMAEALLQGWLPGLGRMGLLLLPHGLVELPTFVLASAVGLHIARRLVPERPEHDSAWQCAEAKRLLTSDQVAQSLGLIVGLLAIAAALELHALV